MKTINPRNHKEPMTLQQFREFNKSCTFSNVTNNQDRCYSCGLHIMDINNHCKIEQQAYENYLYELSLLQR